VLFAHPCLLLAIRVALCSFVLLNSAGSDPVQPTMLLVCRLTRAGACRPHTRMP